MNDSSRLSEICSYGDRVLALTDAWSGWGSTLLGGVIGALTVVLGVVLAYSFSEKSRRDERSRNDLRRAQDERRAAAAQLMVEVSNLRDDVCSRTKGLSGTAEFWHMRNVLFTTHVPLRKYPSYAVVREFYQTAINWRQWVRGAQATARTPAEVQARYPVVEEYREALRDYGDQVIRVLQDRLEDQSLDYSPPKLPALPTLPEGGRDGEQT